jgi:hypothetical protein
MTTEQILTGIKTWVLNKLSLKQDVISDLASIRSGAQAGTTAVQPSDLSEYFNDASYDTSTHRINFYHGQDIVAYVDASLFIVDFKDLSLVVGEALAKLFYDIQGIKSNMKRYTELIDEYGYPVRMGQRVFDLTDGAPTEIPMSLGLVRLDASTGHMWVSEGLTISTSDWKQVQ